MNEKIMITNALSIPLIKKARLLNNHGRIMKDNDYFFLKIDDDFIHKLYPELTSYENIQKPDYFADPQKIGAHISIIYPEEKTLLHSENLGGIHTFQIKDLCKTILDLKEYYVLRVDSPSLDDLRIRHNLPLQPKYKDQIFGFHITIAVRDIGEP